MNDWREILCRVLDGEPLTDSEIDFLRSALDAPNNWSEARQWWLFEQTLVSSMQNVESLDVSRERLLARVILREKHLEVVAAEVDEVVGQRSRTTSDSSRSSHSESPQADLKIRGRRLMSAAVVVVILMIIATGWWPESSTSSYAAPTAHGDFHVLGNSGSVQAEQIERGERIASGGGGATPRWAC